MKYTDTTEKGLEAYITQHLCLVNAFEERHFSNYNRVVCFSIFCKPHRKRRY
jgi:hypothetical protein